MEITKDFIFNGAISLYQPKHGYRVAIDPLVLASIVEIKKNQTVLDVGCGVGTISLILKYFDKSQTVTSLDIDSFMTDLCRKNSEINNLPLNIINCGVDFNILKDKNFDCVVTNPPFYNPSNFRSSEKKFVANFETIDIKSWISFCMKRLKDKGNFYIIHIPEKLDDILAALRNSAGKIEIIPIYSHANQFARRIIIKCKKGSKEPLKISPGIISHKENNEYSDLLTAILSGKFSNSDWF
jgi:tRNA1(Val) A37 N6-methylase TrmN6